MQPIQAINLLDDDQKPFYQAIETISAGNALNWDYTPYVYLFLQNLNDDINCPLRSRRDRLYKQRTSSANLLKIVFKALKVQKSMEVNYPDFLSKVRTLIQHSLKGMPECLPKFVIDSKLIALSRLDTKSKLNVFPDELAKIIIDFLIHLENKEHTG